MQDGDGAGALSWLPDLGLLEREGGPLWASEPEGRMLVRVAQGRSIPEPA